MLSDSEILDNKTQSLDEALQKLEANRDNDDVGPVSSTVQDVLDDESLEIAIECVQTLADLYSTVSIEGVSSFDVQTLRAVQAKMEPIRESMGITKVALERYEGMFTPTRSELNQQVSLEAIQIEFGKVIREWFYKLVDFIANMVNWVIRYKDSTNAIKRRYDNINSKVEKMRTHLRNLQKVNAWGDRDLSPEFNAISDTILRDPKLNHNKITLMGFGKSPLNDKFDQTLKTLTGWTRAFRSVTDDLADLLDSGKATQVTSAFTGRLLEDSVMVLQEYTVEDPNPDYFFDAPEMKGLSFINPKYMLARPIYYMDNWYNLLDDTVKNIKKLKRFNDVTDEATADRIAASIADINTGINAIKTIINTIGALNTAYFKVSACFVNYYTQCYDVVLKDYESHRWDDMQRKGIEKLNKEWDSLLDSMGIFG